MATAYVLWACILGAPKEVYAVFGSRAAADHAMEWLVRYNEVEGWDDMWVTAITIYA